MTPSNSPSLAHFTQLEPSRWFCTAAVITAVITELTEVDIISFQTSGGMSMGSMKRRFLIPVWPDEDWIDGAGAFPVQMHFTPHPRSLSPPAQAGLIVPARPHPW